MKRAVRPLALNQSVVSDSTPTEIIPGLFVGSLHSALNRGVLEGLSVEVW